jgi:hypothetical protein
MLRTMAVFGVLLLLGYLLVSHPRHSQTPPVDYTTPARELSGDVHFTVLVPRSLPAGWHANHANGGVTGDASYLDEGFVDTPNNAYVALEESDAPRAGFLTSQGVLPASAGTVTAGGRTYQVRMDSAGPGHVALVGTLPGGATVVVTGGALLTELVDLAELLTPAGDLPPA